VDERLDSLWLDLLDLSPEEAEILAFEKYVELYLDKGAPPRRIGIHKTHDGRNVKFREERFEHAFYTSGDKTSRQYAKDRFVRSRAARVAWIGPIIAGEIQEVQCWLVPPKNGGRDLRGRRMNRMYVLHDEKYVVWLEPELDGYKFSSAYVIDAGTLRRYCRLGRKIWDQKNIP
jgi:hypothetical protein